MLVIVYAGAIMVLFLFVIMLLNLRGSEDLGAHSSPISKITKYRCRAAAVCGVCLYHQERGRWRMPVDRSADYDAADR